MLRKNDRDIYIFIRDAQVQTGGFLDKLGEDIT